MLARRVADWFACLDLGRPRIVVSHGETSRVLRGLYGDLSPTKIMAQEILQNAFYRLHDGKIDRIEARVFPVSIE